MNEWKLQFNRWDPEIQQVREALCTLTNGYWSMRGAAEESTQHGCHYPGTYLSGVYNRLEKTIAGEIVNHETLVNWPNSLFLSFKMESGSWFDLEKVHVQEFCQELDLHRGLLSRRIHFIEPAGRETTLHSTRFLHMRFRHLAAVKWEIFPHNWSGQLQVRAGIDTGIINKNVERDKEMHGKHVHIVKSGFFQEYGPYVVAETLQSHIRAAQSFRAECSGAPIINQGIIQNLNMVAKEFFIDVSSRSPVKFEKIIAMCHSRDHAVSEPLEAVQQALASTKTCELLQDSHEKAWRRLWNIGDIRIRSRPEDQLMLRLHLFHLLQTASPHLVDCDAGIPARGLTGEMYHGHIFWDEVFAFPFLTLRIPDVSRALVLYRTRRQLIARNRADQLGYDGVLYPWRSASDGSEQTPRLQWNPRAQQWTKDYTYLQYHLNATIVYQAWKYYQATGDFHFLQSCGGKLILEIAQLWSSMAVKSEEDGRYHIRGVMGPDEFHTGYPDVASPGLDDNAYTNIMAVWTLRCAARLIQKLPNYAREQLMDELSIKPNTLDRWADIARRMYVPFLDKEIISQFAGYEKLQELDWPKYRTRYGDIRRMDRILEAEGDTVNRYKVSKQPDVLMMCYLLPLQELEAIFSELGYLFTPYLIQKNIEYYQPRTTHGSTLSRIVFGWILARSNRKGSWQCLVEALGNDVHEIQGGSTSQGIHLGAMAGTVDLIQRCYSGIDMEYDMLIINPRLPESLHEVATSMYYRGHQICVLISQKTLHVDISAGPHFPLKIHVRNRTYTIHEASTQEYTV
ncbi:glycoside hydrolase family 65 protein [Candidatus Nitrospira salsa]